MKTLKALRGAVNFKENTTEEIEIKTIELFKEVFRQNKLAFDDIVCIVFSLTKDITATYPAKAFRENFSSEVSLFSCVEPDIEGGLPLTLRIMILHYGDSNNPVYLYETKNLRKDIFYEHCN